MQRNGGGVPGQRTPPALPSTPSASPPRSRRDSPSRRPRSDGRPAAALPRSVSASALRELVKSGAAVAAKAAGAAKAAAGAAKAAAGAPASAGASLAHAAPSGASPAEEPPRPRRAWLPAHGAVLGVMVIALLAALGLLAMASSRPLPYGFFAGRASRLGSIHFPARGARAGANSGFAAWQHGGAGVEWAHAADAPASGGACGDAQNWTLAGLGFPAGGAQAEAPSFPVCAWNGGALAALAAGGPHPGAGRAHGLGAAAPAPGAAGAAAPGPADASADPDAQRAPAPAPRGAAAAAAARACGAALGIPQARARAARGLNEPSRSTSQ